MQNNDQPVAMSNPIDIGEDFVKFVMSTLDELKHQFYEKNRQYATGDPFANFTAAARLDNLDPEDWNSLFKEAKDMEKKHIAHVWNNDVYGVKVDESLKDIAIYSIIELFFVEMARKQARR